MPQFPYLLNKSNTTFPECNIYITVLVKHLAVNVLEEVQITCKVAKTLLRRQTRHQTRLVWLLICCVMAGCLKKQLSEGPVESLMFQQTVCCRQTVRPPQLDVQRKLREPKKERSSHLLHIHELFNNAQENLEACSPLLLLPFCTVSK